MYHQIKQNKHSIYNKAQEAKIIINRGKCNDATIVANVNLHQIKIIIAFRKGFLTDRTETKKHSTSGESAKSFNSIPSKLKAQLVKRAKKGGPMHYHVNDAIYHNNFLSSVNMQ
jgi:hypothetical protein